MSQFLRNSLLAACALASFNSFSQPVAYEASGVPRIQFHNGILAEPRLAPGAAPARLIAQSRYRRTDGAELRFSDSVQYRYSGVRGGDPRSRLRFDESERAQAAADGSTVSESRSFQTYHPDGTVATYRVQRWDARAAGWVDQFRCSMSYEKGFRAQDTGWTWNAAAAQWDPGTVTLYSRNAKGLPEQIVTFEWSSESARFDSTAAFIMRHDAAGNVVESVSRYGKGSLQNASRSRYTYNNANFATGIEHQSWASGAWTPVFAYRFARNASNDRSSQTNLSWNAARSGWDTAARYVYTYGAAAGASAMTYQTYVSGSWIDVDRYDYTYNAGGQLISATQRSWSKPGGQWVADSRSEQRHYYYAPLAATSIPAQQPVELKVWPLPASKAFNIDVRPFQGQALLIVLSDLSGRTLISNSRTVHGSSTERMDVSSLPGGTYILSLIGEQGASGSAQVSIVR